VDAAPLLFSFAHKGKTSVEEMVMELDKWCLRVLKRRSSTWGALVLDSPGSRGKKQDVIESFRSEAKLQREQLPTKGVIEKRFSQNQSLRSASKDVNGLLAQDATNKEADELLNFQYKGNRESTPLQKLVHETMTKLKSIKLTKTPLAIIDYPETEADDVIATLTKEMLRASSTCSVAIVSPDKDFCQLLTSPRVSLFRNQRSLYTGRLGMNLEQFHEQFGIEPSKFVDYLALVGDAVDNVPGIKGIGKVRARKLLDEFGTLDAILKAAEENRIPGEIGNGIAKSKHIAILSRKLVTLNDNLQLELPPGTKDWASGLRVAANL
jgi:hypothetical protein